MEICRALSEVKLRRQSVESGEPIAVEEAPAPYNVRPTSRNGVPRLRLELESFERVEVLGLERELP